MRRKYFSIEPFIRLWVGLFSGRKSIDGIHEGSLRLYVDDQPDMINNQDSGMTLHSITDDETQALRVTFVNGAFASDNVQMNGAAIFFGGNNEFKMWCDIDNIMKIAYLNGTTYVPLVGFPNYGGAWQQTTSGIPLHMGKSSVYLGLYNRWKISVNEDSNSLEFNVNTGAEYFKMHEYESGKTTDPATIIGNDVALGSGAIFFGAQNNYKLFVNGDGKLVLAQKRSGKVNNYTEICFEVGI